MHTNRVKEEKTFMKINFQSAMFKTRTTAYKQKTIQK